MMQEQQGPFVAAPPELNMKGGAPKLMNRINKVQKQHDSQHVDGQSSILRGDPKWT